VWLVSALGAAPAPPAQQPRGGQAERDARPEDRPGGPHHPAPTTPLLPRLMPQPAVHTRSSDAVVMRSTSRLPRGGTPIDGRRSRPARADRPAPPTGKSDLPVL
jgi:hypothetical protein